MIRILVCIGMLVTAQAAYSDAEADINYRKSVMRVVGGHMLGMGTILKGRIHADDLSYHARGMANVAKLAPKVFPEGSGEGKTAAMPEIWQDRDEFDSIMDDFVKAANQIADAAEAGDMSQVGPAMKALGGSCKACHDKFKAD